MAERRGPIPPAGESAGTLGLWSVVAIGVGGMVGGGIFAVLGLSVELAAGGAPLAFLFAGAVALLTALSYADLSVRFPSRGGTVTFLNHGFGTGIFAGGMNILLWISYVVMLALYASAFGSYGSAFFPESSQAEMRHLLSTAALVSFMALNLANPTVVGRSERFIVGLKILILVGFVGVGFLAVDVERLAPAEWAGPFRLIAAGMVIFAAYEGFELIANTAEDVRDVQRILPRAYYSTVLFVTLLYVLVAAVTVGSLTLAEIGAESEFALAVAAKPVLGQIGFTIIVIAALLSTASAMTATLYGAARLSYVIARSGELPRTLARDVWGRPVEGLILTVALSLVLANAFDITRVAMLGSAGFLLIFAVVNLAAFRLGAGRRRIVALLGAGVAFAALLVLLGRTAADDHPSLVAFCLMLGGAFAVEIGYRRVTGRSVDCRSPAMPRRIQAR